MKKKSLLIILVFALFFSACQTRRETPEQETAQHAGQSAGQASEIADPYQYLIQEKGLEEWQIETLKEIGFTYSDMTKLSPKDIEELLAPGSVRREGEGLTPEQLQALEQRGIGDYEAWLLYDLGYDYEEIETITQEQLDFIFPPLDLVDKIVEQGYDREVVQSLRSMREDGRWNSYKELLDDVFANQPQ